MPRSGCFPGETPPGVSRQRTVPGPGAACFPGETCSFFSARGIRPPDARAFYAVPEIGDRIMTFTANDFFLVTGTNSSALSYNRSSLIEQAARHADYHQYRNRWPRIGLLTRYCHPTTTAMCARVIAVADILHKPAYASHRRYQEVGMPAFRRSG